MRVRFAVEGQGTSNAPYRVPFPQWTFVALDVGRGVMVVDVPDHLTPDEIRTILDAAPPPTTTSSGIVVTSAAVTRWRDSLARQYPNSPGVRAWRLQ